MNKIYGFCLLLIWGTYAHANGTVNGVIKSVQVRETGNLEITFDANHSNPDDCAMKDRVIVENAHIAKKEILSIVLSAMAQEKSTVYYLVGCQSIYNTTYPKAVTAAIIK